MQSSNEAPLSPGVTLEILISLVAARCMHRKNNIRAFKKNASWFQWIHSL